MVDNIDTEIAIIKKDLENVDRLISKMDTLVVEIGHLSKSIALQNRTIENHEKRLSKIDELLVNDKTEESLFRKEHAARLQMMHDMSIDERDLRRRDILDAIREVELKYNVANKEITERITSLEQWKWWLMGFGALSITIISFVSKMVL
jgi:hypothetical protein